MQNVQKIKIKKYSNNNPFGALDLSEPYLRLSLKFGGDPKFLIVTNSKQVKIFKRPKIDYTRTWPISV